MTDLILHTYWRSSAAYRVRIALNLKNITYQKVSHDLRKGEQESADYTALAPQALVPAIQYGDLVITQSPAIMEWLDERFSEPPLMPNGPDDRAMVRAMSALIACDIHPLNNLRILKYLHSDLDQPQARIDGWITRWISDGLRALEILVARHGRGFSFGDAPTLADCYLIPQIYSAHRFGVDLGAYPHLMAVNANAANLEAIKAAHPALQPGADAA